MVKSEEIPIFCKYDRLAAAGELKPHPDNAHRSHPDKQLDRYESVIRGNGWRKSVVVSKRSGFIVKGHGAWMTARRRGWQIPIEVQPYESLAEERRDLIADNRLAQDAVTDDQKLAQLLSEMDGADVALTGYDQKEIDKLVSELAANSVDAEPQIDKAAELAAKWKTECGQIWELGAHRIMCGDSSKPEEIRRLLNGDQAQMVFTDPPYGVDVQELNLQQAEVRGRRKDGKGVTNDDLTGDSLRSFLDAAFRATKDVTVSGACWYVCAPSGVDYRHPLNSLEALGVARHGIVWVKDMFVMGRCDYHYRHENIIYGWTPGAAHQAVPTRKQDSVWEFDRPKQSPEHPTMKPVEIPAKAIQNSSLKGAIVYEPFSGSGTTIIACEQLGRKCRAMEIDPGYVAVAIQRWADATGGKPKLVGSA